MEFSTENPILVLVILLVVVVGGYLLYQKFLRGDDKSEVKESYISHETDVDESKPALLLFTSPSCPHAISFQPVWDEVKARLGREINIDSFDIHSDMGQAYGVRGTPTVLYLSGPDSEPQEYDGPRTPDALIEFVGEKMG